MVIILLKAIIYLFASLFSYILVFVNFSHSLIFSSNHAPPSFVLPNNFGNFLPKQRKFFFISPRVEFWICCLLIGSMRLHALAFLGIDVHA